ncbi:SIR2 family protein [Pantoea sp. CCBC3-3-1]|uniref:SIR2 family protein n=1 Tax=Pantoea sp. CCBC3-3-1 TaxID=2490851 RepID=UPI0011BDE01E|nr:SIR2 family protein [Pantoea sp. CCBC3-3-1]
MAKVYPKKALLNTIYNFLDKEKKISFVFGSPFTMPDEPGGPGVPDVNGIIKIIEKRMRELNSFDDYQENTQATHPAEKYQKSFEYICGWHDQEVANSIIEEAVITGCSNDNGETLNYPNSINDFAKFIKNEKIKPQAIITTNFDPLIQACFDKNGIKYNYYVLDDEGFIQRPQGTNSEVIDIYHIHGFWRDSDTLHTISQLTHERSHLSDSLKEIIGDSTLLVLGYGGWDDIFTESLKSVFETKKINGDIILSFYESESININDRYSKLLSAVSRGILKNKFRCYGGVNCKTLFKELNDFISEKNNFPPSINEDAIVIAQDNLKPPKQFNQSTIINQDTLTKKILIEKKRNHDFIRLKERQYASSSLENKRIISLTSTLGSDRYGFISSLIYNTKELFSLDVYKVDLSKIDDINDFNKEFEKQIGVNLAPFISMHNEKNSCILIVDNVMLLDLINWRESFTTIIDTINRKSSIKLIISGDNTLNLLSLPLVNITALDAPDFYSYINNHSRFDDISLKSSSYYKIKDITQSLPEKIDSLFYDLTLITLEDYINDEQSFQDDDERKINSFIHVPSYYKELINDLSLSEKKENKDILSLLKILTILEFGETFSNIKRYYSSYKFKLTSMHWLLNHGLVNISHRMVNIPRKINNHGSIIITINPLIFNYVDTLIQPQEKNELVKQALELLLGNEWMSGNIKFNHTVIEQILEPHHSGPGNVHSLMCVFLKNALKMNLEREYKAIFYSSLCYIDLLYDKGRFNDAYLAAEEINYLFSLKENDLCTYKFLVRKADSMRMLEMHSEAETILTEIINSKVKITKNEKIGIYIELAHIRDHFSDEEAVKKYANIVKSLTHNKSSYWIGIESILSNYIPKEARIKRLKYLRRKAKNLNLIFRENNIVLQIAKNLNDKTEKAMLYDSVIKKSKDEYTKIRAIINKAKNNIQNESFDTITIEDKEEVKNAYIYLFTQRLDKLTIICHEVLWEVYNQEKNIQSLLNLYRHSSIIWGLNGDTENDTKYLNYLYERRAEFESSEVAALFHNLLITRISHNEGDDLKRMPLSNVPIDVPK